MLFVWQSQAGNSSSKEQHYKPISFPCMCILCPNPSDLRISFNAQQET